MTALATRVLVAGTAIGEVLHLQADLSFWGAIDPLTGRVIDRRHPQYDECIRDRVVVLRRSVGSSSGSAILVETLHRGCGPAGIILGEADQILTLGAVIAREMDYARIPVLQLDSGSFHKLTGQIEILIDGSINTGA